MREVRIDLARRRPRRMDLETQVHADRAIAMGCGDACPYVPTRVESWEIYADRTAHSLRLARLLPGLVEDFEGLRSAGEIRACADAVLEDFDDAPIRSFALLLARRATSDCRRRDVCDRISERGA